MISRRLIFLLILISTQVFGQTEGTVVNYDNLATMVREKNGNAEAARKSVTAAKERRGHLRRSFFPQLELKAGREDAKVGTAPEQMLGYWSAEAKINVYRGGRDRIEDDIIASKIAAATSQAVWDFNLELKAARQNYWRLLANRLMLADIKAAIERNEEHIRSAKRRSGAGVATAADSVQFEIERTALRHALKRLEHEDDVLSNRLSTLIGLPDHKNLVIADRFPHPPEAEFQEREILPSRNPEVAHIQDLAQSEFLRSKQAGRWYLPKIDVYGRYGVPALSEDYSLAIQRDKQMIAGVSVSLDLGQSFQNQADKTAQRLDAQALEAKRAQKSRTVIAEAHELQHDLRLMHELLHDAESDIKKATEFLSLTRNEYARGVKNGPDLQEAVSKLFEIKKRTIELNLEYQIAKTDLEALTADANTEP